MPPHARTRTQTLAQIDYVSSTVTVTADSLRKEVIAGTVRTSVPYHNRIRFQNRVWIEVV
jgi:hypothetical protein